MNSDGDFAKAIQNAQWLVRKLMSEQKITIGNVKQHFDWSKKNCPQKIRSTPNGWTKFIEGLKKDDTPEYIKILRAKTNSLDVWIKFIEDNKNHPLGRWLPDLIVKVSK